jgi:hypothetical protein
LNRRTWLALISGVVVLLAALGGALHLSGGRAPEAGRVVASRAEAARLQALASAACTCTRAKGESAQSECWKSFKAAAPGPPISSDATACAPVSTQTACFATAAGEVCVVTGYEANGVTDPALDTRLCSAGEARAIEFAFQEGWRGPDGKAPDPDDKADWEASNRRAAAAMNSVARKIMRGEPVTAPPSAGGCAG